MNIENLQKKIALREYLKFEHKPVPVQVELDAIQAEKLLLEESKRRQEERLSKREENNLTHHFEAKDAARKLEA